MKGLTFKGGIHVMHKEKEGKELTRNVPLSDFSPNTVVIPVSQHIGAPSVPCVNAGDYVLRGQLIAKSGGFVGANIHSSVSGKVIAVESRPHVSGEIMSIVIENDHKNELSELTSYNDLDSLSSEQIKEIITQSGIVGMGGATFPTHVKFALKPEQKVDFFIINGCECEPFLNVDNRAMIEYGEEIVFGILAALKATNASQAIIGIEENKPKAIESMQNACKNYSDKIKVLAVKTKFPQGGEKQLIYALTGRVVPMGDLPISVGAIVDNIGTCKAIADAIKKGLPLIDRPVTVAGDIKGPKNLVVPVGTMYKDIFEHCGGFNGEVKKIISGGPMTGFAVNNIDVAVTKGTSGIIILNEKNAKEFNEQNCIRCGKCNAACPMGLMPQLINAAYLRGDIDRAEKLSASNCINCGCCSFECPAKRDLANTINKAKNTIIANARNKAQKEASK